MAELPGHRSYWQRIFDIPSIYDLILGPVAGLASFIASYTFFSNKQPIRFLLLAATGTVSISVGLIKTRVTVKQQIKAKAVHELEGCLHVVHALLMSIGTPDKTLRITLQKPVDNGQKLQQITEYVGDRRASGCAGRNFSAQSGIIGLAFRTKLPYVGTRKNIADYEAFILELISQWQYTEEDARKLNPACLSWMAIPLIEDKAGEKLVRGILYMDSAQPDYFRGARELIPKMACIGIARFVNQRYI